MHHSAWIARGGLGGGFPVTVGKIATLLQICYRTYVLFVKQTIAPGPQVTPLVLGHHCAVLFHLLCKPSQTFACFVSAFTPLCWHSRRSLAAAWASQGGNSGDDCLTPLGLPA